MKQFLLATANALARRDIRNGDLKKFVTSYIAGRRKWYLIHDDIARLAMESRRRVTLDIRLAVPADLPSLYALERRYSSTYSSGVASGHEGVPIAFRHLGTSAPPRVADFSAFELTEIYVHDIYTCPEWRRRGVTRELMIESNRHPLSLGYGELFSLQELDNRDSIATMQANGLRRVGILTRTCVLGHITLLLRFELCRAHIPKHHLEIVQGSIEQLRLLLPGRWALWDCGTNSLFPPVRGPRERVRWVDVDVRNSAQPRWRSVARERTDPMGQNDPNWDRMTPIGSRHRRSSAAETERRRSDAEHSVLHAVIRKHLEPFLREVSDRDDGLGLPRLNLEH